MAVRAAAGSPTTWRTSPIRYWPVTTGRRRAVGGGQHPAISSRVTGLPDATLSAPSWARSPQRQLVGAGHVLDVHEVAPLSAVLEHPRRPAAGQRLRKIDATPA